MPDNVTFEPLLLTHRHLITDWTALPHVKEWWSDAAANVDRFFDEDDDRASFIACIGQEPTAYIQSWAPTPHKDYPWQRQLTLSTRGIDMFIGPVSKLGIGYGHLIAKCFARRLFADGATRIVVDPDKRNQRAIAAYARAGFRPYDEAGGNVLMELWPDCTPSNLRHP